jgi:hypothetical protein
MKIVEKLHIIAFLMIFGCGVQAQKTIQPKGLEYEYKGIVYNTERSYDLTLHTNGFAVAANFGKLKTYYKTFYYHLGLGYITHQLEDRQNKNANWDGLGTSKSFKFGKQNYLYLIRGGVGNKRYKSEKAKRRGVAVGWSYEVGPVIGVLRPVKNIYLVDLNETGIKVPVEVTYDDDPELFLDYPRLFGRSTDLSTLLESTIRPGIQAKAGAHFALGAYDQYVRAVEIGLMVDYFGVKMPLIVENEQHSNLPIFINIYATVQLGTRE